MLGLHELDPSGVDSELRAIGPLFSIVQLFAPFVLRSVKYTDAAIRIQAQRGKRNKITPYRHVLEDTIHAVRNLLWRKPMCLHPYVNAAECPMLELYQMLNNRVGNNIG